MHGGPVKYYDTHPWRYKNGLIAFGAKNKYLEALLKVMKEAVDDKFDYIDWWLYETSDCTVYTADVSPFIAGRSIDKFKNI